MESIPKEHVRNSILSRIKTLKEEEIEIDKEKVKGTLLRTKITHIVENEIEISELARLEKRRADENLIYALEDSDGVLQEGTQNVKDIVYGHI